MNPFLQEYLQTCGFLGDPRWSSHVTGLSHSGMEERKKVNALFTPVFLAKNRCDHSNLQNYLQKNHSNRKDKDVKRLKIDLKRQRLYKTGPF